MTAITEVQSLADWRGEEFTGGTERKLSLTEVHQAEVIAAVDAVDAAGLALTDISRENFPLPTLGPFLKRLTTELMDGRGFGLVQGVPVAELSEGQRDIAAVGIGCHVGYVVPQNPGKAALLHVRDVGADPRVPTTRSYQHSQKLGYHADPTDIVALLCIRPAKSGGLSTIVSSVAVHNEIVRIRPDLAEVLYQPWWFDLRTGDGPDSFRAHPVYIAHGDGRISVRYGPDYMRSAQRGAHVPPLTADQVEAMAVLDRLTNDPRFVFAMDLHAGDMQFLNNHVVLHSRTAYEDHPEPERRRDLIRLWLDDDRNPNASARTVVED
ncbi:MULTISPECIES: TauD/TfdA family dioxygenase [unclassified Streptomyces]|uniref:TauD/TfdA family dioxygenase n=1 Tax=unclassified Streptomyces TaxID=2593676 RepID=UPI0022534D01|nr:MULTISPECIES: TauD/TfdA family dioxygenase [unclassified Streptomyces]MCX4792406.1 TauD/TfdA family dioxygenase [Streptomyces sp. NBC_01221]MCX4799858.1 TauD/TfdA family dioxygenase [Streptomyces sp. NBC_01242]WSP67820.1 TauD/TfdA family dioxygenase [Streptomyces sp. NBC_01240]